MYTIRDYISNLQKEYRLISHLVSQITDAAILEHRLSPSQRSIKELLQYLACAPLYQVQLMKNGTAEFPTHDVDQTNFTTHASEHLAMMEKELSEMTQDQLEETVKLRGGAYTGSRFHFLVHAMLPQLVAYKMQLFLQLKHAGLTELSSSDIWMGMTKKA